MEGHKAPTRLQLGQCCGVWPQGGAEKGSWGAQECPLVAALSLQMAGRGGGERPAPWRLYCIYLFMMNPCLRAE